MGKLLKTLTAVATVVTVGAIQAGPVTGQGTWESTLQARDLDGSASNGPEAFYDSVLNLTWLRAGSTAEDTWANGKAWAEQERYGTNGWRLPKVLDTGTEGCDFSFAGGTDCGMNLQTKTGDPTKYEAGQVVYSEMAHLFYVTLGNKARCNPATSTTNTCDPQPDWGLTNTGEFLGLQSSEYWSDTEFAPDTSYVWLFSNFDGSQGPGSGKGSPEFAMAVLDGDVLAVPEPATPALVAAALLFVAATRKRSSALGTS